MYGDTDWIALHGMTAGVNRVSLKPVASTETTTWPLAVSKRHKNASAAPASAAAAT